MFDLRYGRWSSVKISSPAAHSAGKLLHQGPRVRNPIFTMRISVSISLLLKPAQPLVGSARKADWHVLSAGDRAK